MAKTEKASVRIALAGALLAGVFLALLAWGTRTVVRRNTFADIDSELSTLASALGSDFETTGLAAARREALEAGLAANAFEFRLPDHSAILFDGERVFAATGDLLPSGFSGGIAPYRARPEIAYTALEPYSGKRRICRFLVTRLEGRARGATLVLFRPIETSLRALARIDEALAGFVLLGFLGTGGILAAAVRGALHPVEEITGIAQEIGASDLSRRVRIRSGGKEFRDLTAVINSLLERLERAFAAQSRLVSDAAHELKTPTAVLVGEAQEVLRDDLVPEQRRRSLQTISSTALSLARQVDGLLLLSRGDAAALEREETVDLKDLAEEAVLRVEPLSTARGVSVSLTQKREAHVCGDPEALATLASNLLSNAIAYSDPGTTVELETGTRNAEAYLEVRDRGPGIPEEERDRVFGRFVRLAAGRARYPEGSGLGLAIVDQVAGRHGGRIVIEARGGGGSVFRAVFPEAPGPRRS